MKIQARMALVVLAWLSCATVAYAVDAVMPPVDVDIQSRVSPIGQPTSVVNGGQLAIMVNIPTLRRVILAPDDLIDAALKISLFNPPASGSIAIYVMRSPAAGVAGAKASFEAKPLVSIPFGRFVTDSTLPHQPKIAQLAGLGDIVRKALNDFPDGMPLLFVAQTPMPDAKINFDMGNTLMTVKVVSHPKLSLFTPPVQPRKGVYVTNRDGHLYYGKERLRLWGCVRPQVPNIETADRMAAVGFNAIRMWGPRAGDLPDGSSPLIDDKTGTYIPAVHGDGSALDEYDKFFARAKSDGLFIMATGLTSIAHVSAKSEWLKGDGKHWDDWKKAMSSKPDEWTVMFMAAVDDRLFQAREQQVKDYLTHVNPYTGRDYAHEEAIAIYELANENAHVKRTLEKGFDRWPPFFVSEMQQSWNDWLLNRYHDDAGVAKAWTKLESGESLGTRTVKLEPVLGHKNAYSELRASDFIRFLVEINGNLNKRIQDYARSFAQKGIGVAAIPFSYDTQYMPSNTWLYDDTHTADVANFGMYFWSLMDPLTKPPSMYVMDSTTVEGKITAIYETMDGRPDPYRAAYPYRLAALASWEDWDAIFFHYWDGYQKKGHTFSDEDYMAGTLSYIAPTHYWTAVYYDKDPALLSAMAIAGQMFINGDISPAPHPLTYVVGAQSIFDMSGLGAPPITRATYSQGARIRFEPDSNTGISIEGKPEVALDEPPQGAIAMGNQVLWDWPNGRLIIDTPTAKAYVGTPHGNYRFKDGTVVGGFAGNMVSFGMVSMDGKPLTGPDAASNIYISAANDARNTGYHINFNEATDPMPTGGPLGIGKLIDNNGTSPVIVDHVPYQVWFPTNLSGNFDGYDLARRHRLEKPVVNGHIEHDGSELYIASLSIENPGTHTVVTPESDLIGNSAPVATANASTVSVTATSSPNDVHLAGMWNPLPGVKWADSLANIAEHLRAAGVKFDAITVASEHAHLSNTNAILNSAAEVDVIFHGATMSSINATFIQPPLVTDIIATYDKLFGSPVEKNIAVSEDKVTTVKWSHKTAEATLTVTLTETQGTLGIVYTICK